MRFTAVLRANSRAKVRRTDPPLILRNFPSPVGSLTIVIRTRHDEKEFGIAVPRELWVEAQGDGLSLEDGLNAAWGAAASVLPVIALVTNAAIGDLQPHLAFETTEADDDRAFFQSTVDAERGIPLPGRRIPVEATVATLEAIATTGRADGRDAARLMRAANQYLLALRYWKRHYELLCVSHLDQRERWRAARLAVTNLQDELADVAETQIRLHGMNLGAGGSGLSQPDLLALNARLAVLASRVLDEEGDEIYPAAERAIKALSEYLEEGDAGADERLNAVGRAIGEFNTAVFNAFNN